MISVQDFKYDASQKAYLKKLKLDDSLVNIVVSDEATKDTVVLDDRLEQALRWVTGNEETILAYCAGNLLDLKNESWVSSDEDKVSEEQFKHLLKLQIIHIQPDGGLELTYGDGDLFWGHEIVVKTDPKYKLYFADIEG